MFRRQTLGAVPLVGTAESAHLPARQPQHPGSLTLRQPPLDHPLYDAHAIQLLVAHGHCLHALGGTAGRWRERTFLTGIDRAQSARVFLRRARLDVDLLRRMEQQHGLKDTVIYPFHFALGPKSTLQQKRDFPRRTADELIGRV